MYNSLKTATKNKGQQDKARMCHIHIMYIESDSTSQKLNS